MPGRGPWGALPLTETWANIHSGRAPAGHTQAAGGLSAGLVVIDAHDERAAFEHGGRVLDRHPQAGDPCGVVHGEGCAGHAGGFPGGRHLLGQGGDEGLAAVHAVLPGGRERLDLGPAEGCLVGGARRKVHLGGGRRQTATGARQGRHEGRCHENAVVRAHQNLLNTCSFTAGRNPAATDRRLRS